MSTFKAGNLVTSSIKDDFKDVTEWADIDHAMLEDRIEGRADKAVGTVMMKINTEGTKGQFEAYIVHHDNNTEGLYRAEELSIKVK